MHEEWEASSVCAAELAASGVCCCSRHCLSDKPQACNACGCFDWGQPVRVRCTPEALLELLIDQVLDAVVAGVLLGLCVQLAIGLASLLLLLLLLLLLRCP